MKKTQILLAILVAFAAAACNTTVDPGSARIEGPSVTIGEEDPGSAHPHRHGKFCPPGQAKKGRC